jgi:hypothetical protein
MTGIRHIGDLTHIEPLQHLEDILRPRMGWSLGLFGKVVRSRVHFDVRPINGMVSDLDCRLCRGFEKS